MSSRKGGGVDAVGLRIKVSFIIYDLTIFAGGDRTSAPTPRIYDCLFVLVFIVDTEYGAAEGEHFAKSREHRSVDFAHRRDKEGGENQYGSERSHTDSQDDLQGAAHKFVILNKEQG